MEAFIDQFRIRSLRGQIEASRLCCLSLVIQLEKARTDTDRAEITHRHEKAMKQTEVMEQTLGVLETMNPEATKSADKFTTI